jgi:hypothetical protein
VGREFTDHARRYEGSEENGSVTVSVTMSVKTDLVSLNPGCRQGRQGSGANVMVSGIGKAALLEYVAESAVAPPTILRCRGTRLESELAFAALHELLWPVMQRISTLPQPQAKALNGALGMSGDVANRFLIGVAVLTLVGEPAGKRPVLIVADDAQWPDEPSAQCLALAARRMPTDPADQAVLFEDPADYEYLVGGPQGPADGWINSVTIRSTGRALAYDVRPFMRRISPTPLLMVVASDDQTTPPSLALEAYDAALEPKELVMISGGHYGVYWPHLSRDLVTDAAARWFETHLGKGTH